MRPAARSVVWRAPRELRAADRRRRAQLERELGAYASPSDRGDLETLLAASEDPGAQELRDILAAQARARDLRG